MTISDIFKKSFLDGFTVADINIYTASIAMVITCVLGLYIFLAYRVLTKKTFYSKNFNISLVGIALITAGIILTIQSSIVVSLGMVGALSIVRFRTAIKDPIDLMFLFWSIGVGIICGVGLAEIAIVLSVLMTVVVVCLNLVPVAKAPLILVINAVDIDAETRILFEVKKHAKHFTIKSRNMTKSSFDLIIELRTCEGRELINDVLGVESVTSASLMAHDGEVTF